MTSDELRKAFLDFFESKGHKIIPSSSLIPHGDPTLLLTSAGMVQIKPYFLGEATPPSRRLASCQKCFRTTDIERVGDTTHLTFFEMLGNFSVGDYFKKETIAWAYEFITRIMKLPADRLWATVFLDDDEAFGFWRDTGMPAERILRFGEKDNFWGPAGDSGPCGPDTEIFYDLGKEAGCGESTCGPGCSCGRFVEIGTLVFMQFNQAKDGKRTSLPKPSIDTGMGIERNAVVVQGKKSVYETDLFAPLLERISKLSGKKYGANNESDNVMRVVAEHSRGITFLIADGVLPSNEGRGYVLRRLLRRAALFGKRLGLEKAFLTETAGVIIKQMGHAYPELEQRKDFVLKVVELEEARFAETLNTGLELLDGIIEVATSKKVKKISGSEAFKLYDTYGFPVELTKEIAAERGFSVDLDSFDKEMEKQKERARATHKFELAEKGGAKLDLKATAFTGYNKFAQETELVSILINNEVASTVKEGQEASLILQDTPFYGEMGGQVGDTGEIRSANGRFQVTNTVHLTPDIIVHQGRVTQGSFSVGDRVEAEVDRERRLDIARNHTATHLLQAALRQVLGEHIQQRGSLVAPERFRFDFSHLVAMTKEEIERAQQFVNEKIRQNLTVYDEQMPYQQAVKTGAIALFDEKYGDTVRVLRIGKPPVSAELCGGTHANTTGEIGFFQIISEGSIGAGLRRIEAVTGRGAENYIKERLQDLAEVAASLEAKPDDVVDQAQNLAAELKNERKRVQDLTKQLAKIEAETMLVKKQEIGGMTVIKAQAHSPTSVETLKEMSDFLIRKIGNGAIILASEWQGKPVFVASSTLPNVDAREIIRVAAAVTGGSGGGRKTLAQGGGKDLSKIEEALAETTKYFEEHRVSR